MNDFVFYKKRKFVDLISDTFAFFRKYASNYFSNYLVVNGSVFIATGILFTVMFFFYSSLPSGFGTGMLFLFVLLLFSIFLMLFVVCFPIAYTELLEKNPNRTDITSKELLGNIKKMFPRAFSFGLISIFRIGIPYIVVLYFSVSLFGDVYVLFQLINYFLSTLLMLFVQQAMLLYIKDKEGYFSALSKVIEQLKERFWDKIGATFIMSLISSVIIAAGIIIPVIIFFMTSAVSGFNFGIGTAILVFVLLLIVVTITFVVSNLQIFLQILIHLGEKEAEHSDDIDLIGQNVEE